ncbi:hypothetical protein [Adhaeretor mobilis]|uniref:Uncharacterized protein n=1 Tax=Adhaeretor mobilis TaxID=1930276 RepID=A0A517MWI8_9BACT|nr:hypothetical protein [Adhaeretor mobilis]QDS99241.1 hypothetical protein HG15A2_25630 [Adhaeretor mobilis]
MALTRCVALTDVPGILPERNGKKVHHATMLNRFLETTTIQADQLQSDAIKRFLYGE